MYESYVQDSVSAKMDIEAFLFLKENPLVSTGTQQRSSSGIHYTDMYQI